jgi:hypothetical protein
VEFVEKARALEQGYLPVGDAISIQPPSSGEVDNSKRPAKTLRERVSTIKRRTDLNDDWLSLSQTGETTGVVRDAVTISAQQGKLYLQNKETVGGFDYEAWCDVFEKMMLVGLWQSVRPAPWPAAICCCKLCHKASNAWVIFRYTFWRASHAARLALGRDEDSLKQAVETLRSSSSLDFAIR